MKKVVSLLCFTTPVCAAGLPSITPPNGNGAGSDPFQLLVSIFEAGLNIAALLLIAVLFLTVVKNGWQKYHQLGEEGSKTTWRDLASNLVAGALLICLGTAMAVYALNIY